MGKISPIRSSLSKNLGRRQTPRSTGNSNQASRNEATALGVFNNGNVLFGDSYQAGLWNSSGTLLGEMTVASARVKWGAISCERRARQAPDAAGTHGLSGQKTRNLPSAKLFFDNGLSGTPFAHCSPMITKKHSLLMDSKKTIATLCLLGTAVVAWGQTVIDTTPAWTSGSEAYWGSQGGSDTPTYGQTFQAPAGVSVLSSIQFGLKDTSGPIPFQAYVYAWNGTGITGSALFASSIQTLNANINFQSISIDTASTTMTPGNDYMAFFSTLGDGGSNGHVRWQTVPDSTYTGGTMMFNNVGVGTPGTGSISDLSSGWSGVGSDTAFKFTFDATPAPEPATMALCGMSLLCAFGLYRAEKNRTRRQSETSHKV